MVGMFFETGTDEPPVMGVEEQLTFL